MLNRREKLVQDLLSVKCPACNHQGGPCDLFTLDSNLQLLSIVRVAVDQHVHISRLRRAVLDKAVSRREVRNQFPGGVPWELADLL